MVLCVLEGLSEVRPDLLRILEPDAEPQQARRDAVALPAVTALDQAVDASEGGGITHEAGRGLHAPRGVAVGDVERDEVPEVGIADELDLGVGAEPLGDDGGGPPLAKDANLERAQAAKEESRLLCGGRDPGEAAEAAQLLGGARVAADDDAEEHVVVPAQCLRRAVEDV